MKTVKKFEGVVMSFVYAVALWLPLMLGSWTLLYDGFDLCSDEAMIIWIPYMLAATYWIIRKLVFRIIRICKK